MIIFNIVTLINQQILDIKIHKVGICVEKLSQRKMYYYKKFMYDEYNQAICSFIRNQ